MNKNTKTFCILPWIHLSTRPNGHLRLCCTANASSAGKTNDKKYGGEVGIVKQEDGKPANLNTASIAESLNNDYMKSVRTQMMNGEIPASCTKCFDEEAAGHRSKRHWETKHWTSLGYTADSVLEHTEDDGTIPVKLPYIDLRLGTKCNLACVMCSPHDSSKWVKDWNELYPSIENESLRETMQWNNKGRENGATYNWYKDNPEFWNELYDLIPDMQQLYFAGGEPLIIDEHYRLLEEIIDRGYASKISLRYNSNGIEIPEKLLELWSKFKHVKFHFSIDDIFERNEYIRYPTDWTVIEENLDRLEKTPDNIVITIACAVQALNIYYIPDFIKWKLSKNYKKINCEPYGAGLIDFHFVYHPAHLNVKVLPQWFKDKVAEKFEEFYVWLEENHRSDRDFLDNPYGIQRLKGMVNFMNSDDWSIRMPEFREYINHMDRIRGTVFSDVFPEMADLQLEPVKLLN